MMHMVEGLLYVYVGARLEAQLSLSLIISACRDARKPEGLDSWWICKSSIRLVC
jgi:preprotein translocase subunit SecF